MSWELRLAPLARRDIDEVLEWTERRFGPAQRDAYATMIVAALRSIAEDPGQPRCKRRDELHTDARVYHIGRRARPMFVFRVAHDGVIEVARLLHDAMDVSRHLPEHYRG